MMNRGMRRELAGVAALGAAAMLLCGRRKSAGVLGLAFAGLRWWPDPGESFAGQSVVITGGSRGLGLALAEAFLLEGAKVALLARDEPELERARALLIERTGHHPITVPCDVTDRAGLATVLPRVSRAFGRVDILVNNAGAMVVGPFDRTRRADFESLMDIHVHAVVSATQAVMPVFRRQGGGRIVNICSVGGKIAVPHLSAYCAAKFALAGLSETMAAELAGRRIQVTTVFPGLMRTGSAIHAETFGQPEKEFTWFALGAILPGLSVSAEGAARRILNAVRYGDTEVVFPSSAKLAVFARTHYPELFAFVCRRAAKYFPAARAGLRSSGAASAAALDRRFWFKPIRILAERAERRWNQQPNGAKTGALAG
ncbi:MAG TPA: SDR family oxidoreductase [Opitutaceae bacterium]|jgi:NAD(P)-dependent dehydrogenase (short-subunit alcohol dehydrogenase family)|nr:SDR family oxidoreductase [Opitutaceae bacterium]